MVIFVLQLNDMVYLTKEMKEYYMNDFTNNVVNCSDKYWGLDKGLLEICTEINKNKNVQTVYSKKYSGKHSCNPISYLWILISEDADVDKINKFIRECQSKIEKFEFMHYSAPEPIKNERKDIVNLCVTDPKYLQHGYISVSMCSEKLKDHKFFWETIKRNIKNW